MPSALSIADVLALAPVVPVITIDEVETAADLARALVAGGLPVIEVTLRTPAALPAIAAMRTAVPDAVVGAGTVLDQDDLRRASDAGANFAVSPGWSAPLLAAQSVTPLLPGVATASDVMAVRAAGLRYAKLFPAEAVGGLALLDAFAGPFADMRFCPTGGITTANVEAYLKRTNVVCVGGSWIAPRELLRTRAFDEIERRAHGAATLQRASSK